MSLFTWLAGKSRPKNARQTRFTVNPEKMSQCSFPGRANERSHTACDLFVAFFFGGAQGVPHLYVVVHTLSNRICPDEMLSRLVSQHEGDLFVDLIRPETLSGVKISTQGRREEQAGSYTRPQVPTLLLPPIPELLLSTPIKGSEAFAVFHEFFPHSHFCLSKLSTQTALQTNAHDGRTKARNMLLRDAPLTFVATKRAHVQVFNPLLVEKAPLSRDCGGRLLLSTRHQMYRCHSSHFAAK